MLPNVPLAFLALLALLPGWIFVRLAENRTERPERSQLAELLELASVGFSTSAISALVVAGASIARHFSWLFNVDAWARRRGPYLGDHLGAALGSVALVLALSCLLAVGFFFAVHGRRASGGSFTAGGSVWVGTLATRPDGMMNVIGIQRHDGSLVEGLFFGCTAGTTDGPREIALTAPIYVTPAGGARYRVAINRIVVLDTEIAAVTVVHTPKPVPGDEQVAASSPALPDAGTPNLPAAAVGAAGTNESGDGSPDSAPSLTASGDNAKGEEPQPSCRRRLRSRLRAFLAAGFRRGGGG